MIHSYHNGYKWTDDITRGIRDIFETEENIDLRIEYLDTKHISSGQYQAELYQLIKLKYKDVKPDLLMSADDAALNFLLKYADELFPGAPVVFGGANFFDPQRLTGQPQFTGISEEADIKGTLDVALSLQPDIHQVVFINDTTITGKILHEQIVNLVSQYPQLTFKLLEDITMDEARQQVSQLAPDSIVILTIFSADKTGNFYEYDTYTSLISQSSAVPVYGTWDFSLGYGIVGGKLTSGYADGQRMAHLAQRIFAGENPANIPVDKTIDSHYMFDYQQLQKFELPISALPPGSVISNRPDNPLARYAAYLWLAATIFLFLLITIVIQNLNIQQRRKVESALRQSESRYRNLFDGVPVGLYRSRPDGTILEANQTFVQIYGFPDKKTLLGTNAKELYENSEDRNKWMSLQTDMNATYDFVTRARRYDGSLIWIRNKSLIISDEQNRSLYYEGSLEDVTATKQAEESLRLKTEELEKFFDCNLDLLCIADVDGYFHRLNTEWERILGYPLDEMEGKNFLAFVHPDDIDNTLAAIGDLVDKKEVLNFTNRYRCQDGSYRWLEWRSFPVGNKIYAAARDITERRKSELALAGYAQHLEALRQIDQAILASESPEAIVEAVMLHLPKLIPIQRMSVIEFDFENDLFTIIAVNSAAPTTLRTGRKLPIDHLTQLVEVLRTQTIHIVNDIENAPIKTKLDESLRSEGIQAYMNAPMRVQGELIGALNLGADTKNAFSAKHIETAQDIANLLAISIHQAHLNQQVRAHALELEKRVAERTAQLEAINQELEAFSYSVAHDLRAPLRAIDGFSRILSEDYGDKIPAEAAGPLKHVRDSTRRMNQLIEDLLNLSRLARGNIQRQEVDLSRMAGEIVAELRQRDPERSVELSISEGIHAQADARLLRVVLENLLGNAWKFTTHTPAARIEFGVLDESGQRIYYVRDNGAGFNMAYSKKLFGAFQRLHNEAQFPGTGIGLATVKRIIHRHGGRIWAEGQEEKGATFYFTL